MRANLQQYGFMHKDLIPTTEVALMADVSVATVNRWAADGKLKASLELPGVTGARLFRRSEVERFLASRTTAAS